VIISKPSCYVYSSLHRYIRTAKGRRQKGAFCASRSIKLTIEGLGTNRLAMYKMMKKGDDWQSTATQRVHLYDYHRCIVTESFPDA